MANRIKTPGTMVWWATLPVAVVLAAVGVLQTAAQAHELRPAIFDARLGQPDRIELRITLNLEAWIAGIGARHADTSQSDKAADYDRLRAEAPEALRAAFRAASAELVDDLVLTFDGRRTELAVDDLEVPAVGDLALARTSALVVSGTRPVSAATMTLKADARLGDTVLRVTRADAPKPFFSAFLQAGETTPPIALQDDAAQADPSGFFKYVAIGFEHIVPKGLDHILFVVGLFLLSPQFRPLMGQVTSFTLAHSVTLGLGIFGLVSIPAAIVEPLIAASIVFVAVENLFTDRLRRWRPAVIFAFGLVHGLGFAGVLAEIGLPRTQFVTGLVGFNLGVELGQLAVIAACFLGVGLWFRHRQWYRRAIAMPASVAVALVATFWFIERVA